MTQPCRHGAIEVVTRRGARCIVCGATAFFADVPQLNPSADDEMARWIARPIFPEHPHVATAASSNRCVYMWQGQRCGENVPPVIMFPVSDEVVDDAAP